MQAILSRIFGLLVLALLMLSGVFGAAELPLGIIVTASQSEAERVLASLRGGADFGSLARSHSLDPTASDGGYLGVLDPSGLRTELRNAVEGLTAGQLSPIVRIPTGYAIVKVFAGPPDKTPPPPAGARQDLSGAGTVRLTYDYAGFASALRAVDRLQKPPRWNDDLHSACEVRTAAIPAVMDQLKPLLARPDAPPALVRDANTLLGDLSAYSGTFEDAIRYEQAALKVAEANFPERIPQLEESIGVIYLQRAGGDLYPQFVFPHPLKVALTDRQKDDLRNAKDHFTRYLKLVPQDGEARWLLNLACLLSEEYPSGVPKEFLIPPAILEPSGKAPHFLDVAARAGLNHVGQAGGAIIEDFDNDGLLDVMVSSVNDCEPLALFHNNGDGTFTNRAADAGLLGQTGGLNIVQTDYNNDGCKDVLVLRGGWEYPRRKSLLRNNCDGTFSDVTKESGLGATITATQTAVWADFDNDGFLDLVIGNENAPTQLFLNKHDGTFTDIAGSAGIGQVGFTKGVAAADFDNDGFTDLYISALNGRHYLYRNNANRTFSDVTKEAGVQGPWTTFGAMFFDYNNDGLVDLLVASYGTSVEDVMKGYLKQPQGGETLHLFRNVGNGKFQDVSVETGLNRVFMPMGLNYGDVDNDGYPDFYLGVGNPSYASPLPNVMFHNDDGRRFTDITVASGTGVLAKGHGVAFGDLDRDGDEDLFVVMGGAVPGDRNVARLFENPGNDNDWLSLRLVGEKSNRAAVGARIKATFQETSGRSRSVYRTVSSGGSFGASPFEQHFGLGKVNGKVSIEIYWPASKIRQSFSGIAVNQAIEIRELAKEFRTITTPSFALGKQSSGK